MLVDILVFRFFLRSSALETVGWLGFFFLQVWFFAVTVQQNYCFRKE